MVLDATKHPLELVYLIDLTEREGESVAPLDPSLFRLHKKYRCISDSVSGQIGADRTAATCKLPGIPPIHLQSFKTEVQ
jgi:hypothetical protein